MNARDLITPLFRSLGCAALTFALAGNTLPAQEPDTFHGAIAASYQQVQIVNDRGEVVATINVPVPPTVHVSPNGPTIVMTDQNGTRLFDKDGQPLSDHPRSGNRRQEVVMDKDCAIIIDDDQVRLVSFKGGQTTTVTVTSTPTRRARVLVENDHVIIIDNDDVKILDKKAPMGAKSYPTNGFADVVVSGKRIVIRDGSRVRILDEKGTLRREFTPRQVGQWQVIDDERYLVLTDDEVQIYDEGGLERGSAFRKTGTRKQQVIVCGGRVILVDDDRVRILNRDGQQLTDVGTSGSRAEVRTTKDRIIITDDGGTRTFGKVDARLILAAETTDGQRQYVASAGLDGSHLVVTDGDQTRIYDGDGNLQGDAIPRSGWDTQRAYSNGDRIGIVDTDQVRLFDLAGNPVGESIAFTPDLELGLQMFDQAFAISDFDAVRIFDRDGNLQGSPIHVTDGLQHVQEAGGNLLIAYDNFLRILRPDGTQIGQTLAVGFEPEITPMEKVGGGFESIGLECGQGKQYAFGTPAPGQELIYELGNGPAGAFAQLSIGTSNETWGGLALPFDLAPLGAPGCLVYNDLRWTRPAVVGDEGFVQVEVVVPDDAELIGFTFYSQWQILAPGANALGVQVSDGMATRIGSEF